MAGEHTDVPGVYLKQIGQGRVVYFPWDIDRLYWEVMAEDHGTLLRNAIEWAANEPPPVEVTGLGMFDVTVWRQKESMTVHLVNLTNPMAMRPNAHQLIPSRPSRFRCGFPRGRGRPGTASGGRQDSAGSAAGGTVRLTLPSVLDHEVIAIDLA